MAAIQPLDATGLRAVLAELQPALVPSRFEKAQQCDGRTLQIGLRTLMGTTWLELSWLAEAPRLLAIAPPPRQGDGSTLARQLQHGLRGLALVAIHQADPWERIVELAFAPRPGDAVQRSLVLELMGRHSNLFLLDGQRRVIALGHQVRAAQSRVRPIGTGDPWQPPPPPAGEPPSSAEAEPTWRRRLSLVPLPLRQALMGAYQGISPALAGQLCEGIVPLEHPINALDEDQWQALAARWRAWLAAVEHGRFQFAPHGERGWRCWVDGAPPPPAAPLAINQQLAAYHRRWLGEREQQRLRAQLEHRLGTALARERRLADELEQRLAAAAGSEALQHEADALLCQPAPSRPVIEQAQKLYQRARKLRRSRAAIEPRLDRHRQRIEALETSLTFAEQADPEELLELDDDLIDLLDSDSGGGRAPRRRHRSASAGHPPPRPLELRTVAGLRLQVGRNHRQNEWISLRQARRGDLWFHAQELPGSHVVLKASEAVASEADLAAAADLAAHFSRGRGNGRVPVVMVATDDLQRIPGTAPGTVRHRGGAVLWGQPERARVLLAGRQGDTVQP
ncbi:MAG: NFACT RNA binding domain-containing protein [Cyanobacteriota bacterium]|nr:NFACT RNA binding domain-containing protein [Cyanobacteriota bacterium]